MKRRTQPWEHIELISVSVVQHHLEEESHRSRNVVVSSHKLAMTPQLLHTMSSMNETSSGLSLLCSNEQQDPTGVGMWTLATSRQ
jgi:hypothetical protein